MSFYQSTYGTDWTHLTLDEATERAYALGVADRLGQDNRREVQRIYDSMDSGYGRNMIELAFVEGRREAEALVDERGHAHVWSKLVEDTDPVTPDTLSSGSRDSLPEALTSTDFLKRTDVDSRKATRRPEFLDR